MTPIFIASKGRADKCSTALNLQAEGVPFVLVVEPQEVDEYRSQFPLQVVSLPKSDQGISYARNFILAEAREADLEWFWMLDDDISKMYMTVAKKNIPCGFEKALRQAQFILEQVPDLAVGAMEYQQYSWSAGKPVVTNSYCDVAVLINVNRTMKINYRDNCKEDRDFVLQCLQRGWMSARSSWTAFTVPKNGSNKGGLQEAYKGGLEKHWSARMVSLWPGICELKTKSDGRPDVKIHWRKIGPKHS